MKQLIAEKREGVMYLRPINPIQINPVGSMDDNDIKQYDAFEQSVKRHIAAFACTPGEVFTEGVDVQLALVPNGLGGYTIKGIREGLDQDWMYIRIPVREKEPIFKQGASRINIKRILHSIQDETRPMNGHSDPGALQDCWAEIFDQFDCVYDHDEVLKIIGKVIERTAIWAKKNPSGIPILEVKYDDLLKKQL